MSVAVLIVACGGGDDDGGQNINGGDTDTGAADTSRSQDAELLDASSCTSDPCVIGIGAGGAAACALIDDASVRCWGSNAAGQLGNGTALTDGGVTPAIETKPTGITGLGNVRVVSVGGGGDVYGFACALLSNSTVQCWGANQYSQLGRGSSSSAGDPNPAPVSLTAANQITTGFVHACAVLTSGDISCWGSNGNLQLGQPYATSVESTPTVVPVSNSAKFKQVSAGIWDTCATTVDGKVMCWGIDDYGVLGYKSDGGVDYSSPPRVVDGLDGVVEVSASRDATCALTSTGTIDCWGNSPLLGRGDASSMAGPQDILPAGPILAPASMTFTQIERSRDGFCALASDQSVWCWGVNPEGAVGTGSFSPEAGEFEPIVIYQPTKVAGLGAVTAISGGVGASHFCALETTGTVKCWGDDTYGELAVTLPELSPYGFTGSSTPLTVSF